MLYELNTFRIRIQRAIKDVETIKAIRKVDGKYQERLELKTKRRIDLVKGRLNHDSYNLEYGFRTNPSGNVTVRECILCLDNDGYEWEDIEEGTRLEFLYYILDLYDVIIDKIKEKYVIRAGFTKEEFNTKYHLNRIPVDKKTEILFKEYDREALYIKSEYDRFTETLDDEGYLEIINWHSRLKMMGEL